jgi:Chaperone of endosialidase
LGTVDSYAIYSAGGNNHLETGAANVVGLDIVSNSGQTANLQRWLASDGSTVLADVNKDGGAYFGSNVGIGTSTPYSRLTVWGPDTAGGTAALTIANSASTTELQVFDNGNATLAGTLTQNSDARLKTNVQSLNASSSLAAINALNPVSFNWIDPSQGATTQVGFIAQDVEKLFPELVSTTSATTLTPNGTLGLNYIGFIAPIISALQSLSAEVQTLIATEQSFAHKFTTDEADVGKLCVTKSDGTPVCITGDQLSAVLTGTGQSPSNPVQISAGSFTIASSSPSSNEGTTTSTTTDTVIIVAASSTPPTSPPTDATTSAATSTTQ